MSLNIAIDGPAGAGKSTIAKAVAKKMNLIYVDTGAMYRAMALYMLRNQVDLTNPDNIGDLCQNADITIRYEDGVQVVVLNNENVNGFIRTEEVGNAASTVSAVPAVRAKLLDLQRKLAMENDCIMDGRDIGTCVLPNANKKIYLTASSEVRARRRYDELVLRGEKCDLTKIKEDIEKRDYNDMHRAISPLQKAADAWELDSSYLSIDEVIDQIIRFCLGVELKN